MALIPCRNCGNMVSDRANACPRCGTPVQHRYNIMPQQNTPPTFNDEHDHDDGQSKGSKTLIWVLIVVLLIGLLFVIGSTINKSKKSDTTYTTANDSTYVANTEGTYSFIGTVDNYGAWMYLDIINPDVRGVYHYNFAKSGVVLHLRGKIDKNGNVVITEKAPSGLMTGRFEGVFDGKTFDGTFYNLNNGKNMPFSFSIDTDEIAAKKIRDWNIRLDDDEDYYEEPEQPIYEEPMVDFEEPYYVEDTCAPY